MLSDSQKKLLLDSVRTVKDFPKEGVNYKDITTMIAKPACLRILCDHLADYYEDKQINAIASIESRGFIFGSILAYSLGLPFIPIRKAGKLPFKTTAFDDSNLAWDYVSQFYYCAICARRPS